MTILRQKYFSYGCTEMSDDFDEPYIMTKSVSWVCYNERTKRSLNIKG